MKPPCLRFKPNAARVVKRLGLGCSILLAIAQGSPHARAQDESPDLDPDLETPAAGTTGEPGGGLPQIRARTYPGHVLRRSRSGKMYLFGDPGVEVPSPGKILLLKQDGAPVMALRVLKTYPENNQFAAKSVRTYNGRQTLNPDESFDAVEKVGDVIPPAAPPAATAQDKADLDELEGKPAENGEGDLESGLESSPSDDLGADLEEPSTATSGERGVTPEEEEEIDRQLEGLEINESDEFTPTYQWLSVGAGIFKANDFLTEGFTYFMAGGARYQLDLGHQLLFNTGTAQDSFSLEGGLYYYSIAGYAEIDPETGEGVDAYTVIPLVGDIKYTIWLDPDFALFGLVGITKNLVTEVSPPTSVEDEELALSLLTTTTMHFGGGALFRIGPSWYARVDAGTDFIGGSIVLTF